jgi:ferredoxin
MNMKPMSRKRDVLRESARQCSIYRIIPDKCKGCGLCARKCPVGAISGEIKKPYVIDKTNVSSAEFVWIHVNLPP